jgi:hypothetical protein
MERQKYENSCRTLCNWFHILFAGGDCVFSVSSPPASPERPAMAGRCKLKMKKEIPKIRKILSKKYAPDQKRIETDNPLYTKSYILNQISFKN